MNKAKEFFKENQHSITNIFEFAESYHQSRVKAISDDEIKVATDEYCPVPIGYAGTYEDGKSIGFEFGVNWIIDKLLKQ